MSDHRGERERKRVRNLCAAVATLSVKKTAFCEIGARGQRVGDERVGGVVLVRCMQRPRRSKAANDIITRAQQCRERWRGDSGVSASQGVFSRLAPRCDK